MKLKTLAYATTALCAVLVASGTHAQSVADIKANHLLDGFSLLMNTPEGRHVLDQNLATVIATNSNATEAERNQAVRDNTLAALLGSTNNGLLVADALGSKLNLAFQATNSIAKNYSSTTFSPAFQSMMSQATGFAMSAANTSKDFFANGTSHGAPATGVTLPAGGQYGIYDLAYTPDPAHANVNGNSRPLQVAPDEIQSFTGTDYFGDEVDVASSIHSTVTSSPAFPSGHSAFGFSSTLLLATMLPEKYQELMARGAEYGNSRVVLGVHYPLDVIGARIQSTYTLAQMLNNNPDYTGQNIANLFGQPISTADDFQTLWAEARDDLRSMLEEQCGASIASCIAESDADRFSDSEANDAAYQYRLTYGMNTVGDTTLAAVVPEGAEVLIASRFPYMTTEQLRDVLASTELQSGHVLDDGSGWARLDLYTAAGGYGALDSDVEITMSQAAGGFSASDAFSNDITGTGGLTLRGNGTLELSGANTYSGATTVAGGTLNVSGSVTSATEVQDGGRIGGNGTTGDLTIASGGRLAPGESIGTLHVDGDLTLAEGAIYELEADAEGNSDRVAVLGTASLNGSVFALAQDGDYGISTDYTILTAAGGVSGAFAGSNVDSAFLDTSLTYGSNDVTLRLDRNDTSFRSVATTGNGAAAAEAVEALGEGNAVFDELVFADAGTAAASFTSLSGELHATVAGALTQIANNIDGAVRDRIAEATGDQASAATNVAEMGDGQLWWQAYGNWAESDADEVSGYERDAAGTLIGFDAEAENGWRGGFYAGFGSGAVSLDDSDAQADLDSYHLGIYGGTRREALGIRLGASHTLNKVDTQRHVSYGSTSEMLTADYDASTTRFFGEASWRFQTGQAALEPFAALEHVILSSDSFAEKGGNAALESDGLDSDTTFATLGLRGEREVRSGQSSAVLRGELGWQHAFGDVDPTAALAFAGGSAFEVTGAAITEDAAILRGTVDMDLTPGAKVSVGYAGQFGKDARDHALTADLRVRF
ncbi:autotransporter domain-containing protein [Paracoccus ravus]|uniref:autotransporter domain-containing protein n=1 Tax=Paracoccus ravus TaxID=2447760 RepID=UPI00106E20E8|nr:autotransporter domain-containing protein [Paracoccus ravus]